MSKTIAKDVESDGEPRKGPMGAGDGDSVASVGQRMGIMGQRMGRAGQMGQRSGVSGQRNRPRRTKIIGPGLQPEHRRLLDEPIRLVDEPTRPLDADALVEDPTPHFARPKGPISTAVNKYLYYHDFLINTYITTTLRYCFSPCDGTAYYCICGCVLGDYDVHCSCL